MTWSDCSPKSITTTRVSLVPVPGTAELFLYKNSLEILCTLAACLDSGLWVKYKTLRSHFRPLHLFFFFFFFGSFYFILLYFYTQESCFGSFLQGKKNRI